MRKLLLSGLLIFLVNSLFSQDLIIHGNSDPEYKYSKIYYTKKGEPFSEKNFIKPDLGGMYIFKAKIKDLKKGGTDILVFSQDINASSDGNVSCTHKINIKNILESDQFKDQKNITLRNDFNFYKNCSNNIYYEANEGGYGKFSGTYKLTIDDATYYVILENEFYNLISSSDAVTPFFMNSQRGSWSYIGKNNALLLFISYEENKDFGTRIDIEESYRFIVSENEEGDMTFKPDNENIKLERR